ncbi:MAG TPA: response regulator [Nannocystis exedens]|nr:response regulator [Nannocystis exedens]
MSASSRKPSIHILIVVDEPTLQASIHRRLAQAGHRTAAVSNVRKAIERLRREPYDIVISDLHASPGDGAELLQWLGSYYPSIPVLVLIEGLGAKAKPDSRGSVRIIEKPVDLDELTTKIETIGKRDGFYSNAIEIELFDYVQMMAITGRDKHILVTTPLGVGSIWFEHGDIAHAQFLSFRGEDAFYKILSVGQGVFRETLFRPPPQRTVSRSSTHLLMEAARLQDEGLLNIEEVRRASAEAEAEAAAAAAAVPPEPESEFDDWASEAAEVAAEAIDRLDDITMPTDDDDDEPVEAPPTDVPKARRRPNSAGVPSPRQALESDGVPVMRRRVQTLERVVKKPHTQPNLPAQPDAIAAKPRRQREARAASPPPPRAAAKKGANDLFDDPETREALLGQFWQYEGVDGVAIISSTGKVMAEDMRNNSTAVTLAGFFMRGAARMARMLGYHVFDGVIARSKNGQQIIMIGMGATSAVLSVDQEHDPDVIRDEIMGVESDR